MNTSKILSGIRTATLLGAVASWFVVFWMVGIPLFASRNYFFGGMTIGFSLWAIAGAVAATVKCPKCGKRMLISTQRPTALCPDWQALRDQFIPLQALSGKSGVHRCPYCNEGIEPPR
ncbi:MULTISPECIES: hypothetical protein [Burkholderia]|uniref:Uncharacterized protein n=1 Tax=Burkholderia cenocepacia TaxID=95486 RepID=A0ABD4UPT1_9BURK|nr:MULTISPECIES: hypothetical protein [Burkholderia]MBG0880870.1 hypothetical protein [Burkholderia sp. 9775_39]MBG0885399.1 hypothetical protein [Burkholderia sp. 9773_38]MBR8381551.1 hypothetical protein [Burkholderia cenocepacia]MCW3700479.1 hypothetical protein [Burkholderia cenocepacia]MCW3704701.1 hypothetical protein [Burkholderia cenocepacia]